MHCTEVKKSTDPPRNVRKSKKGSHNSNVALHWNQKEYLSSQKRSHIQKRFAQQLHCTEVKKSTYPPRNVRKSQQLHCTEVKKVSSQKRSQIQKRFAVATVALHWSKKVYLSSQKRSQIQKRFAHWQLHCTEKRVPILPETFANPKKVRTTIIALHWSQKEYLSSQKRSQILK